MWKLAILGVLTINTICSAGDTTSIAGCEPSWYSPFASKDLSGRASLVTMPRAEGGKRIFATGAFTLRANGQGGRGFAEWRHSDWDHIWSDPSGPVPVELGESAVGTINGETRLFAAGKFRMPDGTEAFGVGAWRESEWEFLGTIATTQAGWTPEVRDMQVLDTGTGARLYLVGHFNRANSVEVSNVASWDGHAWDAVGYVPQLGQLNGSVHSIDVYDDGSSASIVVGGNGLRRQNYVMGGIARLRDGTWWPLGQLIQNIRPEPSNDLAVFDDGSGPKLYSLVGDVQAGDQRTLQVWDGSQLNSLTTALGRVYFQALTVEQNEATGEQDLWTCGSLQYQPGAASYAAICRWNGSDWDIIEPLESRSHYVMDFVLTGHSHEPLHALVSGSQFGARMMTLDDEARWFYWRGDGVEGVVNATRDIFVNGRR